MKKVILSLFVGAVIVSCNQAKPTEDASSPATVAEETTTGNTYGSAFTEDKVISAAQLQSLVQGKDSTEAVVTAEIVESCQSKGCWMDVKLSDNSTMKVTFRDYGFFLPVEDLKGRTVVFTGTAKREVISVDDQRHYAQDAGKSKEEVAAITQPKEELRFVADGVILK